eukprot:Sspe_Gene.49019::Locus_25994_Transcript_1_1_Confidence_1.000_Length_1106::g.49019::m.49019
MKSRGSGQATPNTSTHERLLVAGLRCQALALGLLDGDEEGVCGEEGVGGHQGAVPRAAGEETFHGVGLGAADVGAEGPAVPHGEEPPRHVHPREVHHRLAGRRALSEYGRLPGHWALPPHVRHWDCSRPLLVRGFPPWAILAVRVLVDGRPPRAGAQRGVVAPRPRAHHQAVRVRVPPRHVERLHQHRLPPQQRRVEPQGDRLLPCHRAPADRGARQAPLPPKGQVGVRGGQPPPHRVLEAGVDGAHVVRCGAVAHHGGNHTHVAVPRVVRPLIARCPEGLPACVRPRAVPPGSRTPNGPRVAEVVGLGQEGVGELGVGEHPVVPCL